MFCGPAIFCPIQQGDPLFNKVVWLLPGFVDFVDYGPLHKGTASVVGEGLSGGVISCPGTAGQQAEVASSPLGASPDLGWCAEGFFTAATGATGGIIGSRNSANKGILIYLTGVSNTIQGQFNDLIGSSVTTLGATYTPGVRTHFALNINSTGVSAQFFLGGVASGLATPVSSGTSTQGTKFCAGNWSSDVGNIGPFTGNIDNIRITQASRYTSNFTPPTGPFPTF